ncbi:MAG: hypothetical protein ACFB00_00905 [Parvularculaceae bacterium]
MLTLILMAAAAGRYKAEVAVRETRAEIARLKERQADERREIDLLRVEVAHLESPARLADLAAENTDLRPASSAELFSARDFLTAFVGVKPAPAAARAAPDPAPAPELAVADVDARGLAGRASRRGD